MKGLALAMSLVLSLGWSRAWAYGLGQSTLPMPIQGKFMTAEATAIFSDSEESSDGGVGMQFRYTHRLSQRIVLDGGFGLGSGDRSFRAFVGSDFELYPDYQNQPRISVKANLERAKELEFTRTLLTAAPTASKGFSFWGHRAYPFVSLPLGLSLQESTSTYESIIGGSLGVLSPIPIEGMEQLNASLELNVDLKDYYNGLFLGLSYPL